MVWSIDVGMKAKTQAQYQVTFTRKGEQVSFIVNAENKKEAHFNAVAKLTFPYTWELVGNEPF